MSDGKELGGKLRKCPICGKTFIPTYGTIYKLKYQGKMLTFCGYNCYRKIQKEIEENSKSFRKESGY